MSYFKNDVVHLVSLSQEHLDFVFECNNLEIINQASGTRFPNSKEDQRKWIERTLSSDNKKKLVVKNNKNENVGLVSIANINLKNRNAELGIYIHPQHFGNKYSFNALSLLIGFAFKELNLHKLYAVIHEENVVSQNLFKKLGFALEAIHKDEVFKGGKYINVHYFTLFNK